MTKNGNNAEKRAARQVQNTLGVPYTTALRLVRAKKTEDTHWGQAAAAVIEEKAGPGFPGLEAEVQPVPPADATAMDEK